MAKLTPKKARFLAEYLVDGNGTRAAIEAGFSAKTAAVKASQLLKEPLIAAAIAEQQERVRKKLDIRAERILDELAKIAFLDVRDFYDRQGNLRPLHELDSLAAAAIGSFDVERKEVQVEDAPRITLTTTRVKPYDKIRALELLGKNQKLFTDVKEVNGKLTLEQLVCGDDENEGSGGEAAA